MKTKVHFSIIAFAILISPSFLFADWHIIMMTNENGAPTEKHVYITDFQVIAKTDLSLLIYDKTSNRITYSSMISRTKWEGTKAEYDSLVKLGVEQFIEMQEINNDSLKEISRQKAFNLLIASSFLNEKHSLKIKLIEKNSKWNNEVAKQFGVFKGDSIISYFHTRKLNKKLLKDIALAEQNTSEGSFSLNSKFHSIKKFRKISRKEYVVNIIQLNEAEVSENTVFKILEEKADCTACNETKDFNFLFLNEIVVEELMFKMNKQ